MAKPSSALLSILAILASSNASPTPLPFLCPPSLNKRTNIIATSSSSSSSSSTSQPPQRIPVKFTQGEDGLWTRVDSYTLYGSTVKCSNSCPYPAQVTPSGEDELQVSDSSLTTLPPSTTYSDDIQDSLPLGWNQVSKPNSPTLILALSLVLAFFICIFIIGCVFWRRSIVKRRRLDLEAEFKAGQLAPSAAQEARDLAEKESKAKHKIWARATARWKANVRHAARQRKGKRVATSKSSPTHQPSHSANSSRGRLTLSLPPSPASSRRSSIVSLSEGLPEPIPPISPISPSHNTESALTSSLHTNIPTSPPAYHHSGQASPYSSIPHVSPLARSRRTSQSSSSGANPRCSGISTPIPFHAAHVATDDKALLARLADLASRPPEHASADGCDSSISAPAWHEEFDEIPPDLITSNEHPPDVACMSFVLPPPPSKERMAATDFYEYSLSFDDMEPELEPSAPPFQLDSPPLLDDDQIIPSAPPFIYDTEDVHPSAPQQESTSCHLENPTGQDHDRTTSTVVRPVSTSRKNSETGDDIILPDYRP